MAALPPTFHIHIATITKPDGSLDAVLFASHPSDPIMKMQFIDEESGRQLSTGLPVDHRETLGNITIGIDLHTSPYTASPPTPQPQDGFDPNLKINHPWPLLFSRKISIVVPYLIQDTTDVSNYAYGDCKIDLVKSATDNEQGISTWKWRLASMHRQEMRRPHSWDTSIFRPLQQLKQHMTNAPLATLPSSGEALLSTEHFAALKTALVEFEILGDEGCKWAVVKAASIPGIKPYNLVRHSEELERVHASGENMTEYMKKMYGSGSDAGLKAHAEGCDPCKLYGEWKEERKKNGGETGENAE
jgi:hypothetical protein